MDFMHCRPRLYSHGARCGGEMVGEKDTDAVKRGINIVLQARYINQLVIIIVAICEKFFSYNSHDTSI